MKLKEKDREKLIELVGELMRCDDVTFEFKVSNAPKGLHIICELSPREMEDLMTLTFFTHEKNRSEDGAQWA